MKLSSFIPAILGGVILCSSYAQAATMRCGNALIAEGDTSFEVLKKCGEPADRQIIEPAIQADGNPRTNSVTVETWVYGPNSGANSFLKFIDGRLVNIEIRRP